MMLTKKEIDRESNKTVAVEQYTNHVALAVSYACKEGYHSRCDGRHQSKRVTKQDSLLCGCACHFARGFPTEDGMYIPK